MLWLNVFFLFSLIVSVVPEEDHDDHDHSKHSHSICDRDVDIGFIVDSSGSVQYHFQREIQLVKLLHASLAKRIKKLRCGLITFSNRVIHYRKLKFYNQRFFEFYVGRIVWQGKYTRLDLALDFALNQMFLVKYGHRPGAMRVAILITDGRQTYNYPGGGVKDPVPLIKHLRDDGTTVVIIAIVQTDMDALKRLDDGAQKLLIGGMIDKKVLDTIPHACMMKVCQTQYEPQLPDCERIVDIMYVVDSSGSLRGYFDAEKYFVKSVAEQFDITQRDSRVGFVRFSHIVHTEILFTDYTDMMAFHEAVDDIFYDGGLTRIDLGLQNAETEFLKPENEARLKNTTIMKFVVLLTDGRQRDEDPNPKVVADRLRSLGIQIIVIGVGKKVDAQQMQEIAGAGIIWYNNDSFDELINIHNIEKLKGITCHGHAHHQDHHR